MNDLYKGTVESRAFFGEEIQREIDFFGNTIFKVLNKFEEKQKINNIQQILEYYDLTKQKCEKRANEYATLVKDGEKRISDLGIRLRSTIHDRDILSLSQFYEKREKAKIKENKGTTKGYYCCFGLIILMIIYFLCDFANKWFIFGSTDLTLGNNIIIYMLLTSIIGFVSFLMLDFKKRMNISKSILDDIEQKNVIIESYSVLLEKKKISAMTISKSMRWIL